MVTVIVVNASSFRPGQPQAAAMGAAPGPRRVMAGEG